MRLLAMICLRNLELTMFGPDINLIKKTNEKTPVKAGVFLEAPPGFEPGIKLLQSRALPLGHGAINITLIIYHYNFYFATLLINFIKFFRIYDKNIFLW